MAITSGSANVTPRPKSPEIAGTASSGLRRSIPPISQHGESMSNIADIPTPTIPSQECFNDSVRTPPDSSSERPSHLTQTYHTGPLMSPVDLAPHFSPCSLTCPDPSTIFPPVSSYPPSGEEVSHLQLPSIPDRRVGRELEDLRLQFVMEATMPCLFQYIHLPVYLTLCIFAPDLGQFPEEHELDSSGGFFSYKSRVARLLAHGNNDCDELFVRTYYSRRAVLELDRYFIGIPLLRSSNRNSRFRSSGRVELIPPFYFLLATILRFFIWMDFLRRPFYLRELSHLQNLLEELSSFDSLPPPNTSVRTTQCTLSLQHLQHLRRWTSPFTVIPVTVQYDETHYVKRYTILFGGGVCRHADGTTPQSPIFFVNRNSGVGFWSPGILQDRSHDPEPGNEAPLERGAMTHIRINVRPHFLTAPQRSSSMFVGTPSQWPGYRHWAHDITTRDLTSARNLIKLVCLMNCVGTSVEGFFNVNVSFSLRHHYH